MLPEQLVSTVHRSPVECFVYQMSAFSTCVMVRPRMSAYQVTSVEFRHSSCLLLNKQITTVGARCLSRSLSVFLSHNTHNTTHNPHNTHTYIPRHTHGPYTHICTQDRWTQAKIWTQARMNVHTYVYQREGTCGSKSVAAAFMAALLRTREER
jgi:hypothetical protein